MSDVVAGYYEEKTQRILRKYGPGPRVHFHTGIGAQPPKADATEAELRAAMFRAQESLLGLLDVQSDRRVLDIGCGLGGTALYLAKTVRARVTAITLVPSHVEIVSRFAEQADVGDLVTTRLCDAHNASSLGMFDFAVAVESSCYFDRERWFDEMSRALLPQGTLHVVDCFSSHADTARRFDSYWRSRIAGIEEYRSAARKSGFAATECRTLNHEAANFWLLSRAWTRLIRDAADTSSTERARLSVSLSEHAWLEAAMRTGAVEYLKLSFVRG